MKMFERVTKLMNSLGRKVVLSLGGVRDTAHGKYSKLLTDAAVRKNFVVKAVEFLQTHNFDGLDLAFLVSQSKLIKSLNNFKFNSNYSYFFLPFLVCWMLG